MPTPSSSPSLSAESGEVGALTLTLRQTTDEVIEETTGITLEDVIATYGLVIPTEVEELAAPEEDGETP